jgi:hypothetical protein
MGKGSFYNQNPVTTYVVTGTPAIENALSPIGAMEFICDGSGSTLVPGTFGYLTVPFNCTITSSTLMADQTGSCVLDVRRTTPAAFSPPTHPGAADSLTASAQPTLAGAAIAQDGVLTGWTTILNQGDIVGVAVISATTVTRVTLSLTVQRR